VCERRSLRGDLLALCSFLRRGRGEGGAELFSLGSSDRTHGNGSKLRQGRFRLDIKKHFFTKRVVKHWNRPPGEVVDAPSLLLFKRYLDNALNNMLQHLASPEVVRHLDLKVVEGLFKLNYFYSILFYSILFYSILFYSILFYSILFYSILIFISYLLLSLGVHAEEISDDISSQPST